MQDTHTGDLSRVVLSADGRFLATAGLDGSARVWDTSSGILLRRLDTGGFAMQVALDDAGNKLAFYQMDGTREGRASIYLADLARGSDPLRISAFGPFQLSPDGKAVAVAKLGVALFDSQTGQKLREIDLKPKLGSVMGFAFDARGARIAVALAGEIVVIDAGGWKVAHRFDQPGYKAATDTIAQIAFSGDLLVYKTVLGAIFVTHPGQPEKVRPIPGQFRDMAIAGKRLWTIDLMGRRIETWDVPSGAPVPYKAPGNAPLEKIVASADGSTLVWVSKNADRGPVITVQDVATMQIVRTIEGHTTPLSAVAVRPSGKELMTTSTHGAFYRWDTQTGELLQSARSEPPVPVVGAGYTAGGERFAMVFLNGWVRVRDSESGRLLRQWSSSREHVRFAAIAAGSDDLVTVTRKGAVGRWDLKAPLPAASPKSPRPFDELARPPEAAAGKVDWPVDQGALSAGGEWLALSGRQGKLAVLNATTGAVRWDIVAPFAQALRGEVFLAFTPGGDRLLVSGMEVPFGEILPLYTLWVLDAATGALKGAVHPDTEGPMAFRDGTLLLGGTRPVLLDGATLSRRAHIAIGDMRVTAVAAHPGRGLFMAGTDAGSLSVLNADTGKVAAKLLSSPGGDYITWTPEGAFRASLDGARNVAWTFAGLRPSVYSKSYFSLEGFSFEQFASRFERPDIVTRALAGEPIPPLDPPRRPPSVVAMEGKQCALPSSVQTRSVKLCANVASTHSVDRVRVFVDGRAAAEQLVCKPDADVTLEVPLHAGRNRISVIAYDPAGYASRPWMADVTSTAKEADRPDLWVVSLGVSRYPKLEEALQLEFADDDARSIADALAAQAGPGRAYGRLHATTLLDTQVTVESVEKALDNLSTMRPDDLAVVFLAGHGARLPGEDKMVYLTSPAAFTKEGARRFGIGWDRIQASLARAKGRVLMLLDACHSGHLSTELIAPNEALAKELAARNRAGVLVFAAARGAQLSFEVGGSGASRGARGLELAWENRPPPVTRTLAGGHGLFTSAVLEALSGQAPDRDRSGAVEVGEFIDYVTERVRAASNGKQTPWVARREMFGDFAVVPAKR